MISLLQQLHLLLQQLRVIDHAGQQLRLSFQRLHLQKHVNLVVGVFKSHNGAVLLQRLLLEVLVETHTIGEGGVVLLVKCHRDQVLQHRRTESSELVEADTQQAGEDAIQFSLVSFTHQRLVGHPLRHHCPAHDLHLHLHHIAHVELAHCLFALVERLLDTGDAVEEGEWYQVVRTE